MFKLGASFVHRCLRPDRRKRRHPLRRDQYLRASQRAAGSHCRRPSVCANIALHAAASRAVGWLATASSGPPAAAADDDDRPSSSISAYYSAYKHNRRI
uniref:Uncharacterized protein n=1 Tax=Plectus sambesii TaxID=2011161 RepID=A0A914XGR8_9BILA